MLRLTTYVTAGPGITSRIAAGHEQQQRGMAKRHRGKPELLNQKTDGSVKGLLALVMAATVKVAAIEATMVRARVSRSMIMGSVAVGGMHVGGGGTTVKEHRIENSVVSAIRKRGRSGLVCNPTPGNANNHQKRRGHDQEDKYFAHRYLPSGRRNRHRNIRRHRRRIRGKASQTRHYWGHSLR